MKQRVLLTVSLSVSLFLSVTVNAVAQTYPLTSAELSDSVAMPKAMARLASAILPHLDARDREALLDQRYRLELVAQQFDAARATLAQLVTLRAQRGHTRPELRAVTAFAEVYARAGVAPSAERVRKAFNEVSANVDAVAAARVLQQISSRPQTQNITVQNAIRSHGDATTISQPDALRLLRAYQIMRAASALAPYARAAATDDDGRRYIVERNIQIPTPDGATVCAFLVRPRNASRLPALLRFTIYADTTRDLNDARLTAAHQYVAVAAYSRGKLCSSAEKALPYVHDPKDVTAVIDWIARQSWSDGQVGMYSGSYEGFTQWAATKHMPRALKTIVTGAPVAPGIDVPMEGNIVWNFIYPWPFYTTNNRTLDSFTYNQFDRWQRLNVNWYVAGSAYRSLDSIDGTPNPVFREWISHPGYDAYWQSMIPYREEFAKIDIPVLQTAGYFYGGPGAALYYFTEHYKYRPNAEHYLVIGPYDHTQGQRGLVDVYGDTTTILFGYATDPVSHISIVNDLRYQWLDHVLKQKPRPALLKDKLNYQVMGANVWKHAPSIGAMSNDRFRMNLLEDSTATLTVNYADRSDVDARVIGGGVRDLEIDTSTGLKFVSDVVPADFEFSGLFSGELMFVTNKRDFDLQINLYELTTKGEYFQIPPLQIRASYAEDLTTRKLLTPRVPQRLRFKSIRLVSRKFQPGSRLVAVVGVIKNGIQQINYGSGKDVSDETIRDAGEPLVIKLMPGSYIDIPNWR